MAAVVCVDIIVAYYSDNSHPYPRLFPVYEGCETNASNSFPSTWGGTKSGG